jgi:hypothetical protein
MDRSSLYTGLAKQQWELLKVHPLAESLFASTRTKLEIKSRGDQKNAKSIEV